MENANWNEIQEQSDEILSSGLSKLNSQPFSELINVSGITSGNYLISLNEKPYYIGEGKDLTKRLKQQFNLSTSTFYRNYSKKVEQNQNVKLATIDEFRIQFIPTLIGRKEMEESGIVNLPTKLNKFQLGKRRKVAITGSCFFWDIVQQNSAMLLIEAEHLVLNSRFTPWFEAEIIGLAGLYLVKDKSDKLIYVGESSNVKERIYTHSNQSYFSALRRHIGTDLLGFKLQEVKGKKRYFSDIEDSEITNFLKECEIALFPVALGRYELEEFLIRKYKPLLNRKDNNK